MKLIIAGALFGFVTGGIGFIMIKYWIFPIRHYRRLKSNICKDILSYEKTIQNNKWDPNKISQKRFKNTRKSLSDLVQSFNEKIPLWYKIKLKSRRESPSETARQMMNLINIRDPEHVQKRLQKAKAALLIK